jgi:hypothetical protein
VSEAEPFRVFALFNGNGTAMEDGPVDKVAIGLLQHPVQREQRSGLATAEPVVEILAEEPRDDRSVRRQLLERRRPSVADEHRPMRRDEEHPLCAITDLLDPREGDRLPIEPDGGLGPISRRHPDPEDQVDQALRVTRGLPRPLELRDELFPVHGCLEPFESDALTGALRPDEDRQVPELDVHVRDLRELLNAQRWHRARGAPVPGGLFQRRRGHGLLGAFFAKRRQRPTP